MVVHNIQSQPDFDAAKAEPGVIVVDCFATWCGPCKVIAPTMVEFSNKYTNVRFYKFDVDELPELAAALEVRAMPTFLFFKDGKKAETVVGASPDALENAIKTVSA